MKRPTTRNIVVGIGMALVLVGIVWGCLSLASPGQLEASGGTEGTGGLKSLSLLKKPAKKAGQSRGGLFAGIAKRQQAAATGQSGVSPNEASAPMVTPEPMKAMPIKANGGDLPSPTKSEPLDSSDTVVPPVGGTSIDELLAEPEPLPEAPSEDFPDLSEDASGPNPAEHPSDLSFELPESDVPNGSLEEPDSSEEPIFLNAAAKKEGPSPAEVTPHLAGGGIPLPGDTPFSDTETVSDVPLAETSPLPAEPPTAAVAKPAARPAEITAAPAGLPAPELPKPTERREEIRQQDSPKNGTGFLNLSASAPGLTGSARPGATTLDGPQKAEIVLTKELPPEIQIGREAIFRIRVKNVGAATARNVTLRDAVPAGARFVGSEPAAGSSASGDLTWPAFDLAPEEEKVFECRFVPETEGEIGSTATVSFAAEASGRTIVTRPMLKLAVNAPSESLIGEKIKFDIAISNPGSGTATNVTLLENVPDGLEHPSGRTLNNVIGDIKPGETKKLSLTLRTALPGVISNLMTVTADADLKEEATTEIKVNAPELALEIVGAKNRYLQREAVYHLKVWNPGSAPAKGVKLAAELPQGMEFVRTNNEGVYQESTNTVYWELVELPENIAPGEIELVLKPTGAGSGKLVFRGEGENRLTASTEQEVAIDGIAALSYRMTALTDTVENGGEALFEIVLSNRGTKESKNVQLKVTLPEGMEAIEADGPTRYSPQEDGLTFLPLAKVAPKEDVTYKLKTRVARAGDLRLRAEVGSDDMDPLLKEEESVRVY